MMLTIYLASTGLFARSNSGNICTVALFKKEISLIGNPIPGKFLGAGASVNYNGASGVYNILHVVNSKRAVIYRGVIDMVGSFRASIEEVDYDKYGVRFTNSKLLAAEKYYYSAYPEIAAENKPAYIVMDDYLATVSCVQY